LSRLCADQLEMWFSFRHEKVEIFLEGE